MPENMWKMPDGTMIPVSQMEDDHLQNAARFLYRKCNELEGLRAQDRFNQEVPRKLFFFSEKLFIIGEELQRRKLLPAELTEEQFFATIATWESDAVRRKQAYHARHTSAFVPMSANAILAQSLDTRAQLPPNTIGLFCDSSDYMCELIVRSSKQGTKRSKVVAERLLTLDL